MQTGHRSPAVHRYGGLRSTENVVLFAFPYEVSNNFMDKVFRPAVSIPLLLAAGLTAKLQQAGTYTVFAPTDTAFSKLPAGRLDELLKPENKAKLVALVSYHLASTKLTVADLTKTDEVKTLEGTEIDVDVAPDGKVIEVDDAKILGSELEASNGVLHSIDAVLQP